MYLDEMEWESIEELASDQHGVNTICRGDIINRVTPMYFQAFFVIQCLQLPLLYGMKRGTRLHQVGVLDESTGEWGNCDKVCQVPSGQREE